MTPDSPFAPVFSRPSFLETPGIMEVLRRLDEGLGAREPFLVVTGEPGVGKTALANEAIARFGSRVRAAYLAYPALSGAELVEEIIRRFGGEPPDGAGRSKMVARFEQVLGQSTAPGQVALLVVDDAHALSAEVLEELRLLVNAAQQARRPFEVLLIGLPALDARLDQPALAALRQRLSVQTRLLPLAPTETLHYIHHRISAVGGNGPTLFSRKTCRDIAARSGGIPRRVNALAAEALRVTWGLGDETVGLEHVQVAAATLGGFAPTTMVEDLADPVEARRPAPAMAPRPAPIVASTPAPAPAPKPAPVPAPIVASTPAPRPQDAPPVRPLVPPPPKPIPPAPPARASAPEPDEDLYAPPPPVPVQEPQEWVKRFVGDKGPLQIGSRAESETTWTPLPDEPEDSSEAPPKLQGMVSRPRSGTKPRSGMPMATTVGLVGVVVIGALAFVIRAGVVARGRSAQNAATASATTPGNGSAPVASESGRGAAAPATTQRSGPYTLVVGTYADFQTALEERVRMSSLTGFEGFVIPVADGGPYRVTLGAYRNQERAQSAANMLLRSKTLPSVTVAPLPPKEARK